MAPRTRGRAAEEARGESRPCAARARRRRAGRAFAGLLAAAIVLSALPELAEAERCEAAREAARHKRRGWKLRQADPEAAAAELGKAHELCPDPWYLGHMAAAYEKAGRIRDAMRAIDGYLGYETARDPEAALEARRRLRELLARLEIVTEPPGASILVDGEPPERRQRSPVTVEVDPGVHVVEAEREDHRPARRQVEVGQGEHARVDLALEPLVRPTPEPEPEPPGTEPGGRGRSWGGGAQLGLGAAFPLSTDLLGSSFALLAEVGGGLALPSVRLEGIVQLAVFPDTTGAVVHASVGPRLGVGLGSAPLHLELELTLGLHALVVAAEGRVLPRGTLYAFGLAPALSLAWQVGRSLELVGRPFRLEVTGLGSSGLDGPVVRYGFDLGARYRF